MSTDQAEFIVSPVNFLAFCFFVAALVIFTVFVEEDDDDA